VHGRGATLAEIGLLCLCLVDALGKESGVLSLDIIVSILFYPCRARISTYSSILGLLRVAALERNAMTLVLETLWGNQALDLWCLGVWLLALTLWLNLAADDELANLVEEFPLAGILTLCTVCTDRR